MSDGVPLHMAFGTVWHADIALPQFDTWDAARDGAVTARVAVRRTAALAERVALRTINGGAIYADGLRFGWRDEATFDLHHGDRIDYLPGPGWTGALPAAFYSTMAALTLAWRGGVPCHASAVEFGGKAIVLFGASGAGKSTLAAALLEAGATLITDDLTLLADRGRDMPPLVYRGRPGMRLHQEFAQRLPAVDRQPIAGDTRGKWLVRPRARSTAPSVPLAGFIALDAPEGPIARDAGAMLLSGQLFRPRWMRALPGHAARLRAMLELATHVPGHGLRSDHGFHRDVAAVARARRVIDRWIAA